MKRPCRLLTDLEMPNLNGPELARRVREVQQLMPTPIVMLTSRAADKPCQDAGLPAPVKKSCAADADTLEF